MLAGPVTVLEQIKALLQEKHAQLIEQSVQIIAKDALLSYTQQLEPMQLQLLKLRQMPIWQA
jgi:dihydroneopterin aldolase